MQKRITKEKRHRTKGEGEKKKRRCCLTQNLREIYTNTLESNPPRPYSLYYYLRSTHCRKSQLWWPTFFTLHTMSKRYITVSSYIPINEANNMEHMPWEVESCPCEQQIQHLFVSVSHLSKHVCTRAVLCLTRSVIGGCKCVKTLAERSAQVHRSDKRKIWNSSVICNEPEVIKTLLLA